MADETAKPSIGAVRKYFGTDRSKGGYPGVTEFKADWDKLTPQDKLDLSKAASDGTLTY